MKVLIIGGTRFIGLRLVHQLSSSGHEVVLFHRGDSRADLPDSVRTVHGDRHHLSEHAVDLRGFGADVVVDMIAFTERDARELVATFRGAAGRLVVISSGDVYRDYGIFARLEEGPIEATPVTEDGPLRRNLFITRASGSKPGDDLYEYEKILVERVVLGDSELPGTVLRLPMVYGPGDYQHRLAPYLKRMFEGRPAILLNEGMARWRCVRGYVEDVAAAITLAVTNPLAAGRVYNVAEPSALTEAEWVARIAAVVGWSGSIVSVSGDKMPVPFNTAQDLTVDSTRIRSELGYRESIDPDLALQRTVAWQRENLMEMKVDYDEEDRLLADSVPTIDDASGV